MNYVLSLFYFDYEMLEAAKNREMEHELDKQSMKHQSELQELRAQMKDLLAVEEQKQTQLQMLLERGTHTPFYMALYNEQNTKF